MAKLTVGDLQQMKRDGGKIAVAVVYEFQMARICERAGADLLSVGDSLGRAFLGLANTDDFVIDDMLPFGKAVVRAAERAVVNIDMPTATCKAGPNAVAAAARRIKNEVGADITKVDIRQEEEALFDDVLAVMEAGLPVYPQIGFPAGAGSTLHGASADHDHVLKWAHKLEDAGAAMLDLTSVTAEIYADVSKSLAIPVLGGQTGPEADGRIYVSYGLVGYHAANLDQSAKASSAKFMFDIAKTAIDAVHSGRWNR